jgi:hypothetical protein
MRALGALVTLLAGAACQDGAGTSKLDSASPGQYSIATAREIAPSLPDERAAGGHSYSFRGVYAGISRFHLEKRLMRAASDSVSCRVVSSSDRLLCIYSSALLPDGARVRIEALYTPGPSPEREQARTVTVVRALPIDVDGVALVRALADALEKHAPLFERREVSFGVHRAHVRMGTVNADRRTDVELTLGARRGREVLTVTMSRQ